MSGVVVCHVGLGGNVGDAAAILRRALVDLDGLPQSRLLRASRLYATPAWGVRDQPDFVNAVAEIETALAPHMLLRELLALERQSGRQRADDGSDRWGPRTLDLDILLYGEARIDTADLRVPHPHLHERAFALVPLTELAPDIVIPGAGPASAALAALVAAAGDGRNDDIKPLD